MQSQRRSIGRTIVPAIAALALVLGFSAASTAIEFPAPAAAPVEEPAAAAADAGAATDEVDQARILAGMAVYKDGGCRGCHGWSGNGEREGPNPEGPSLRASLLPMDIIRLTAACGRPGTVMPYFWRDAYRRDSTECYGMTGAQLGDREPPRGPARFNAGQLDDLAYYIEYYVKGRGDITFEECEFYFGVGDSRCPFYR